MRDSSQPSPPDAPRTAFTFRGEIFQTLRLGGPLALGELGWMSTYLVDASMIGRLHNSPLAISASSLGNTIFYAIAFCAIFLLNGLETLIAQAFGSGRREECPYLLSQSFWIAAVSTPIVMLGTLGVLRLLPHFGTPPEIVAETSRYVHALVWSTAPLLAYMALRRYLQSMNRVTMVTISLLTAALVNAGADWVFLFGHLGAPAMGVAGSAWATLVVRIFMLVLLVAGTASAFRQTGDSIRPPMLRPNWPRLRSLLQIGWPSAITSIEELGTSTFMSILCARLGTTLLAAHQVVLDLNAFVYQVAAGLAYATVVRVGQAAGRNNLAQVRRAARASLALGVGFMAVAAAVFAVFAHRWASLYTNSEAVVVAAVPIFTICVFILLGDTTAVLLASALTGLGDTRTPLCSSFVWNWVIGMPLAFYLAFHQGLALRGLWIGSAVSSVGSALTMLTLWRWRMRRDATSTAPAKLSLLGSLSSAP